jgi:hypothetical protein
MLVTYGTTLMGEKMNKIILKKHHHVPSFSFFFFFFFFLGWEIYFSLSPITMGHLFVIDFSKGKRKKKYFLIMILIASRQTLKY